MSREGRRGARERAAIPISLKNGDGAAAAAASSFQVEKRTETKKGKERKGRKKKERRVGEAIEKRRGTGEGGRVGVLEGSVCRVAWPIVCKGSRSSSKEPAEEEEEGSEAN